MTVLIVENPEAAAAIAGAFLLLSGTTLVVLARWRSGSGGAWRRWQERRRGPPVAS